MRQIGKNTPIFIEKIKIFAIFILKIYQNAEKSRHQYPFSR